MCYNELHVRVFFFRIFSRKRIQHSQLEAMFEYLNEHRSLVSGYERSAQARETHRRMWNDLALQLNTHENGASKTWKSWSKVTLSINLLYLFYKGLFINNQRQRANQLQIYEITQYFFGPPPLSPDDAHARRTLRALEHD